MATLAEAVQIALPAGASPDGQSELAAFTKPVSAPLKRTEGVMLGSSNTRNVKQAIAMASAHSPLGRVVNQVWRV